MTQTHRMTFVLAGAYNILWGLYAVVDPQWLFRLAGMPPSNTPQIFACLGMVLGLYGILYLEVARRPEQGWLIAAVGLTGKVLGPLGLLYLLLTGAWPPATLALIITNDLIWWVPFALYLRAAWPAWRATW
ncbi:hypothetical protein Acsp02_59150 [Actinoplanes sp. NBRC 103695]|nr:hypothetical protein Acsp02_59150 [Actinoplanes sp. NBRC 103695]